MAKGTNKYDRQHQANLSAYEREIDRLYRQIITKAVAIGVSLPDFKADRLFSFDDYPAISKKLKQLLQGLQSGLSAIILNGIDAEWTLANNKNSELARQVFGDNAGKLTQAQYRRYFSTNDNAREAFTKRKVNGLNLSDRVWKYTDQFKFEIELGLDVGIRNGLSADEMSQELRDYLRHTDKLFRRVRDEHGELQLSKRAAAYHPGQGVYRSSYKNARRLAATETNMAYMTSDYERWQQLDFVVGIEIKLSNNHTLNGVPFTDICDVLKGRYPKDFKFTGWHPHCRCRAVTILKTDEEIAEDTRRILDGKPLDGKSVNRVDDVPKEFKQWLKDNEKRIKYSKSQPYFIKDNTKYTQLRQQEETKQQIAQRLLNEAIRSGAESIDLRKILQTRTDEDMQLMIDFMGKQLQELGESKTGFVSVDNLHSVQDVVFPNILQKYIKKGIKDDLPYIVNVKGVNYIVDGNHRIAAEILSGKKKIKANIITYSDDIVIALKKLEKTDEWGYVDLLTGQSDVDDFIKGILQNRAMKHGNSLKNIKNAFEVQIEDKKHFTNGIASQFDFIGVKKELMKITDTYGIKLTRSELSVYDENSFNLLFGGNGFSLVRTFRKRNGAVEVHHDFFVINKKYQGKGLSKEVFRLYYNQYRQMGVRYITVEANIDVGGYTWARYGFSAKNMNEALNCISSCENINVSKKADKFIKSWYKKQNFAPSEPFPMRLLTEQPWGKELLLNSNWEGIIDLSDTASRKIFEQYLGF